MAKRRITQATPRDSPGTLVFWCQKSLVDEPLPLKFALKVTHPRFRNHVVDFLLVLIELFCQLSQLRCYERILFVTVVFERGRVTLSTNLRGKGPFWYNIRVWQTHRQTHAHIHTQTYTRWRLVPKHRWRRVGKNIMRLPALLSGGCIIKNLVSASPNLVRFHTLCHTLQ